MAKRQTLHTEIDLHIKLMGICSQEFDYKLCFMINKELNIDLLRIEDIEIFFPKLNIKGSYATYHYEDEEMMLDYKLVANYHPAGNLIPEAEKYDYLLIMSGEVDYIEETTIKKALRNIESVIFTSEINVKELKSKNNLIF